VDFLLSGAIFLVLILYHHILPTWKLALLPLFFIMAFATASGSGILLSALNVKYRDVRMIVPFIAQFGFFLSPVVIPIESIVTNPKWLVWYYANPMVSVIQGFRWAITGRDEFALYWPGFAMSMAVLIIIFVIGMFYFRRTEKTLADVI